MADRTISNFAWLAGVILFAILLKVGLLVSGAFPFNSDEAIVALMGRHILAGESPIFFYGQAYMGSLDAYVVAAFFWIFGQSVWVIRFVQILEFTCTIYTTFWLGKVVFKSDNAGLLSAALVAVPAVNVTLYTTVSLGGYGEALLLGNLILLTAIKIAKRKDWNGLQIFVLGCLIGLGLWTNGLTLVYSVPATIYLIFNMWKRRTNNNWKRAVGILLVSVAGLVTGSLPLWFYLVNKGPEALFREYLGSAVAVETGSWLTQAVNHLINFFLLGVTAFLGIRPPWTVVWLVLPLIPFVIVFWGWTGAYVIKIILKRKENWGEIALVTGVMGMVAAGFVATPFGTDPSGRYFLPFGIILALLAAGRITVSGVKWGRRHWGLAMMLLVFQFSGNIQSALSGSQSFTTQFDATTIIDHRYDYPLIQFLEDNHEIRGYGNYWITYPLAFLSNEKVIFTPRFPYHQDFRYTSRDDRYPLYDAKVAASAQVAIITDHFQALDDLIRRTLISNNITWKEQVIGDYRVFYNLSRPITPDEFSFNKPAS